MRILTNSEMRAADARTIAGGVSGRELMRRAAEALFKNLPKGKKTYIVCGKGNNGGDGWALALRMLNCGEAATVFYTDEQKGEGEFFAAQFLSAGGRALPIEKCDYECEVLVDCLFGTGFHGKVSGVYAEAIERINASGAYVVSADIPSGLNGDNGRGEVSVKADVTVAIQAAKLGHFLGKGKDVCGKLVVEDIGIDCGDLGALLVDGEFCKRLFPPRRNDSNKGSYGRCALIGGSIKYPGAIKLANAGLCALQSGCGLCTIAVPAFLAPALSACVVESTLYPLPDDGKGIVYDRAATDELMRGVKCAAIGPGIGDGHAQTARLLEDLSKREIELIIDADGLNCLSEHISLLNAHKADILLTPHPMEMARLCKKLLDDVLTFPLETAKEFAEKYGVTVLLKGSATLITDGKKTLLIKDGGPCLAKGGSGDVLTGAIAGIAARGVSLPESAAAGSYLCAMAGKRVEEDFSEYGVLPSLVAREIKKIIS